MDDVRTGRATITYRINRSGDVTHEEVDELDEVENVGTYCPHCGVSFNEDFIEQFLRER